MVSRGYISVAVCSLVIAGCFAGCIEEDEGVEYETPFNVWMEDITSNEAEQRFELMLQLTDVEDYVTEYDGEFRVIVYDEGLNEVMNKTYKVKAKDFTTAKENLVVDTWYDLEVQWSDIPGLTPAMKDDPYANVTVDVWFSFGDTTIKSPRRFDDPSEVFSRIIDVDETGETLTVEVSLFDEFGYITKRDGELRFMIRDTMGFEMYNGTRSVSASEFEMVWDWDEDYYVADYHGDIDFDDLQPSNDRLPTGKEMMLETWFTFDGMTVDQDALSDLISFFAVEIPQALLVANEPPVPHVSTEAIGVVGKGHFFDARGSTDDTGTDSLSFGWVWGDLSSPDLFTMNYTSHVFNVAGVYEVTLNVTDFEGAWSTVTVTVEIVDNPFITVEDVGTVTEAGEHFNDTYVVVKVKNVLKGEAVDVPTLEASLYDASEAMATLNGTDEEWPTYLGFSKEVTITLYFVHAPGEFDPARLVIWEREFGLVI